VPLQGLHATKPKSATAQKRNVRGSGAPCYFFYISEDCAKFVKLMAYNQKENCRTLSWVSKTIDKF